MLPVLPFQSTIESEVVDYLAELEKSDFCGDIETSYSSRLAVSTDNSVYQQLPQAVLFPKTTTDVECLAKLANQPGYKNITFSPRGGGTGTNGQSLTKGVVVDLSRYMNQVIEINTEQGWARVQTGLIKDQFNDALRPYGYFFSPELSTSNRATLGGMINTDASGQGSLKYGKTSNHVLDLVAVLADGTRLDTSLSDAEQPQSISNILDITASICRVNRQKIENKFPSLNRFLTGYDLKNALDTKTDLFDITRVLCGAEGTLAFLTEAKLNITPIPTARTLINVKYDSFDAALRNAPFMVEANALSVETIDSRVLNFARQDIVWHSVSDLITDVENRPMLGLNMVEFAGADQSEVDQQVATLISQLEQLIQSESSGIIGYQMTQDVDSINRIYAMRKKAVGLLGATKGAAKPVAFAEDTCVPPENLADFIQEFRVLLDSHQLNYGMFGHVDAGVLHVRPALDMCDPKQEALMHTISDQVVALVAKYRGLMWGEHGKGFRSEYGPEFFGEDLFTQLRRVKAAFDPDNKMNPGKICTPLDSSDELVKVSDIKRGYYDRQIPVNVRDSFRQAMECNGNGLCFNYEANSPMCPSMKVTSDRRHSPKGRAGLVREWLRQLSEQGVDVLALEQQLLTKRPTIKQIIDRISNRINKSKQYDYSHEVHEAMMGCLACKACASQCPIKVDVPDFRSRFLNIYHSRYQRPMKDYLVANIETILPIMAKMPKIMNGILGQSIIQTITKKTIGYVDMPLLSTPTLKQRCEKRVSIGFDLLQLQALTEHARSKYVLIVQDPFTSYYDASVVDDFIELIQRVGLNPILLPFKPNGKAQHIKGFLKSFKTTAKNSSDFLNEVAKLKIPMVGVDPALVLCYRDEYNQILANQRGDFNVLTVQEWLHSNLSNFSKTTIFDTRPWQLFAHCTEKTKLPNAEKEWGEIFSHFGLVLNTIPVGCCGMAGTYGHELDNAATSKAIYDLSWKTRLAELDKDRCLATGYSCRSQVKRFEREQLKHPLQAILTNI